MFCKGCGQEVADNDAFCGKCGQALATVHSRNEVLGDGSINLAGNNNIAGSHLHVGDVYKNENQEKTAYIDREYFKPVVIAGTPVKTSWLVISGLLGFIGSCASIYSVLGSSFQFVFLVLLAFSMFLFLNGVQLSRTRFSRLKWFNLEANKDGEIFISKVKGYCPKCDGTLRLVDLEVAKNRYKTYVRCTRNSDHTWKFDPTVLD
ncbi:MAG: hypothetical protein ACI8WB_003500 [Phenylobacterium sp.]|jgi:hypothetical protein